MRFFVVSLVAVQLCILNTAIEGAVEIGQLPNLQHGVGGTLFAKDETTFYIQDFEYDGQGPTVYVYVYRRGVAVSASGGGIIINWSGSSDGRITSRYTGSNISISLSNQQGSETGLTVDDIGAFTIWCQRFRVFFSRLDIPDGLMLGGGLPPLQYCAELTTNYQVSWTINASENTGMFQLCSCATADQYMSFGISGNDTRTWMVGADVVVAWVKDDGANAVDYLLTSRQQCSNGSGVCPDTMIWGDQGMNDVYNVTGQVTNGLTCVRYSRLLTTTDSNHDLPILPDEWQFIAWAIGPRASEELGNLAFFHSDWPRNGENAAINFGAAPTGNMQCTATPQCSTQNVCGWSGMTITARESRTFRVTIGPSGGERGYEYFTKLTGWGIAFYIDGILAPVLRLRRNVTYTFVVEAGNDPSDGPNYHPLYITDSIDGGILQSSPVRETVYAGFNVATNTPTAAGRQCKHVETSSSGEVATNCDRTLQQYLNTLSISCEGTAADADTLVWTPDASTPNTVYYQCAQHLHLGWKIELEDGTVDGDGGADATLHFGLLTMLAIVAVTYLFQSV